MPIRGFFLTLFVLFTITSNGQTYLWAKSEKKPLYGPVTWPYWCTSGSVTNGAYTYQAVNYGTSRSMSYGTTETSWNDLYVKDTLGNNISKLFLPPSSDITRITPLVVDGNNQLHALVSSSVSGTMGIYYSANFSILRYLPGQTFNNIGIGGEESSNPDPQAPDRYFDCGRICVSDAGDDYLSTNKVAKKQSNGQLVYHRMELLRINPQGSIAWRKSFGDTAKVVTPTIYNTYYSLGFCNNRLYVLGKLTSDSFWYDGVRHKADSGNVLLRFDTAGVYQGYLKVPGPGWKLYEFMNFDSRGNMIMVFTATTGSTVQLDATTTVTVPSIGARHSVVACISPKTGQCLWYSTLYSTFGNTLINAVQSQSGNLLVLTGTTDASMVLNGTNYVFGKEMFRVKLDSVGTITLLQRNPIISGGDATPQTGYMLPSGDLLITDFINSGDYFRYGCDSANAGTAVMSRWTPVNTFPPPQLSSHGVVASKRSTSTATLDWQIGSGRSRILIISEGTPVSTHPSNAVAYAANAAFGLGANLGNNNYVAYNAAGNSVSLYNLKPSTVYYVKIVEYYGCGATTLYEVQGDTFSFRTAASRYYTKSTGVLEDLNTWGELPNGTGNPPPSFLLDSVTFYIHNNPNPVITTDSFAFSNRTTVVLGDSLHSVTLEIPDSSWLGCGKLLVKSLANLIVKGRMTLLVGGVGTAVMVCDTLTNVVLHDSRGVSGMLQCYNLEVINVSSYVNKVNSGVTVLNKLTLNGNIQCIGFTLGQDSIHPGELDYIKGLVAIQPSVNKFSRYIKSQVTSGTDGFFPFGAYSPSTERIANRSVNFRYTSAPVKGGMLDVVISVSPPPLVALPLIDTTGGDTVYLSRAGQTCWNVQTTTLQGGRFTLELTDTNPSAYSVTDMRIVAYRTTSWVAGNYTSHSGSNQLPALKSSDCPAIATSTLATNFFVGINDSLQYTLVNGRPTVPATDFRATDVLSDRIWLQWKRGNGLACIVIARATSPVTNLPHDSFTYTASYFGGGSNLGNNTYVVYNGTGTAVIVTQLMNNVRYQFAVIEYNGYPGRQQYLTSPLVVTNDSTRSYTNYYNKAGQSLSRLGTWGLKSDGSGDTLKSFTWSNIRYQLQNGSAYTIADSLVIAPAQNVSSSSFFVGNGVQPMQVTVAPGGRWVLGSNITLRLRDRTKVTVNGGFSCRALNLTSNGYTQEVELNTPEMVNSISPVTAGDRWVIGKLRIKGGYYYELPVVSTMDTLELDGIVKGSLVMEHPNILLNRKTILSYLSGGATGFGHIIKDTATYFYPTCLIGQTPSGYVAYKRPAWVKFSNYSTATVPVGEPFLLQCALGSASAPATGFPLTDTTVSPSMVLNQPYPTRTQWTSSFGYPNAVPPTVTFSPDVELTLADTIVAGLLDSNALAIYSWKDSAELKGSRMAWSANAGMIHVGRTAINHSWTTAKPQIVFGLSVASSALPLPVTWLSFSGSKMLSNVQLNWATASEINNSHFEIERSADGKKFEFAGRVEGNGTTTRINSYQFVDAGAFAKANSDVLYYRLKQVDFNGDFAYSEIRVVRQNEVEVKQPVTVYPNPFKDELYVQLNNADTGSEIRLMDITGKVWYAQTGKNGEQSIQVSKLPAGVYFLQVVNNEGTTTKKIVKAY